MALPICIDLVADPPPQEVLVQALVESCSGAAGPSVCTLYPNSIDRRWEALLSEMTMRLPVFVGRQAGKVLLTGTLSAQEIISALRFETMAVNPNAQRSLARGANKETTKELLDDDRAHRTPRMKELVTFYLRVMESVERGNNRHGFLGAVQLVIPERFTRARLRFVVDDASQAQLSGGLAVAMSALENRRLATLEADPEMGENVFDIGDGQGRCFAFFSFHRAVADAIIDRKHRLRKLESPDPDAERELAKLEQLRERIHRFISQTDVSFVCYASHLLADGRIVGLDEDAERRLYIESNALNSQATKEEVVKYESFSPVVRSLQEERTDIQNLWMDPEFIEEDAKTVGKASPKLFTLSALTQAFSLSMLGDPDPITNPDAEMFRKVAERAEFVGTYWKRISEIFGPLWLPKDPKRRDQLLDGDERVAYLEAQRQKRNVALQATFLLALGRLGFLLGEASQWEATAPALQKIDAISSLDYRAYRGADPGARDPDGYDPTWVRAMMKARTDRASGEIDGYVFDHSPDKIRATAQVLLSAIDAQQLSA